MLKMQFKLIFQHDHLYKSNIKVNETEKIQDPLYETDFTTRLHKIMKLSLSQ